MLKIIAGEYKYRLVPIVKNATYRPSTSRFREAIFNILSSGELQNSSTLHSDTSVLDLFAGTGSLAFEALSRGAGSITLIDINATYLKAAKEFATTINARDNTCFLQMDATQLPTSFKKYNLIFLDPPYYKGLATKALESLVRGKWLEDNALIIIELAKKEDFIPAACMSVITERIYGNNKLLVLKKR